jgi:hypothetical protein
MSELFLLLAITVFTIFVLVVMMLVFKGWLKRRDEIDPVAGQRADGSR